MSLPLVLTAAGAQPQSPADILAQIIAIATAADPGLTTNLPGSLISDIAQTDVAGVALCDSAQVDLINSITPYSANPWLLTQLGNIYGVAQGIGFNTSVNVTFTGSAAGLVIPRGFIVGDGTYQYVTQEAVTVPTSLTTGPVFAIATIGGTWSVPANSVTTVVSSQPTGYTVSVTNPLPGIPSQGPQMEEDYRAQVIQAGMVTVQGTPTLVKSLIQAVSGVQPQTISMVSSGSNWMIFVAGGDPYSIAGAIYEGMADISTLVGSTLSITGITNANPGVATTALTHGFTSGQTITVAGVTPSGFNHTGVVTVITPYTFSYALDTTGAGSYTSGGVVTPNLRNQSVSIIDYPNTYMIPFVVPLQEILAATLTWNTTATNTISASAVAALGTPALVSYINSIPAGQPFNAFEAEAVFQAAVVSIIPTALLSRMVWTITINGIPVSPTSGTGLYPGDVQSYLYTTAANITITQG